MNASNEKSEQEVVPEDNDSEIPEKVARMEDWSRGSWSLTDRRTDQEVKESMKTGSGAQDIYCPRLWYYKYLTFLDAKDQSQRSGQDSLGDEAGTSGNFLKEMGLGFLEPDDADNVAEDEASTTNVPQPKPGAKRKHNLENVNPKKSLRSPKGSPTKGLEIPTTSHNMGTPKSPRSIEKSPSKPLQPTDLNRQDSDNISIFQHPMDSGDRTHKSETYYSPSPNSVLGAEGTILLSGDHGQMTSQTPKKKYPITVSFETVSDEVMLNIFKWLPKGTLVTCMLVCKRWHRVASDETFWSRLELGNRSMARNALGKILARKPVVVRFAGSTISDWTETSNFSGEARLQYLDLSMCSMSMQTLNALLERCVNLKKLSLENVPIDTETCRYIGNCSRMETLNLSMATGFTPRGLMHILQGCDGLQSLNISWCCLCTSSLQTLVTVAPQRLQRLNLAGARHMTDDMVSSLVHRCQRLQELDLSDCPRLTEDSVKTLVHLSRLEHLALSRCYQVQPSHFLNLKGMPSLRFLDVFGSMPETSVLSLSSKMPGITLNQYMLSAVARPTVGPRRTSIWGQRTRD